MDFTNQTCSLQRRPRCVASIPKTVKLVTEARAKGALIIFSVAVPNSVAADIVKELTPAAGETVLPPLGPDKFIGSDLEKTLKDKGIKTVVAMGTQAQTSVLHTGGAAALRGFKVIVPVDGMSADDVFPELYTAWHLATAARISAQVTLTKFDMIGF
jgi:nicotinamidase-related amidase